MKRKKEKINDKKEHDYWEKNDFSDHISEFEPVNSEEFLLDPKKAKQIRERARKKHLIAIRLDDEQYSLAQKLALRKDMGLSTLIRMWIKKGIMAEMK